MQSHAQLYTMSIEEHVVDGYPFDLHFDLAQLFEQGLGIGQGHDVWLDVPWPLWLDPSRCEIAP